MRHTYANCNNFYFTSRKYRKPNKTALKQFGTSQLSTSHITGSTHFDLVPAEFQKRLHMEDKGKSLPTARGRTRQQRGSPGTRHLRPPPSSEHPNPGESGAPGSPARGYTSFPATAGSPAAASGSAKSREAQTAPFLPLLQPLISPSPLPPPPAPPPAAPALSSAPSSCRGHSGPPPGSSASCGAERPSAGDLVPITYSLPTAAPTHLRSAFSSGLRCVSRCRLRAGCVVSIPARPGSAPAGRTTDRWRAAAEPGASAALLGMRSSRGAAAPGSAAMAAREESGHAARRHTAADCAPCRPARISTIVALAHWLRAVTSRP